MKKRIFQFFKKIINLFSFGEGFGQTKFGRLLYKNCVLRFKPDWIVIEGSKMFLHRGHRDDFSDLIAERGGWDFEETKFLKKIIKKGDTVIDVGANIGYYTLLFSKLVGKEGKIYAYEPLPENFKLLKKNIFINKYKNIVLINRALSNKEKNAKLYIDQDDLGACSLHTEGVVGGVKEKMLNI